MENDQHQTPGRGENRRDNAVPVAGGPMANDEVSDHHEEEATHVERHRQERSVPPVALPHRESPDPERDNEKGEVGLWAGKKTKAGYGEKADRNAG
ncbi:MAG TPA: hypothetical protein PLL78_05135 [Fimbriimonadaceae bacterium]|nr:hypothetical protein [Fimbriimonadaceae bacterium]HRJ96049.1 hypothetical protein [Fimbriimonadaceae bacterium]